MARTKQTARRKGDRRILDKNNVSWCGKNKTLNDENSGGREDLWCIDRVGVMPSPNHNRPPLGDAGNRLSTQDDSISKAGFRVPRKGKNGRPVVHLSDSNTSILPTTSSSTSMGRGRGKGRTLPAWMTREQKKEDSVGSKTTEKSSNAADTTIVVEPRGEPTTFATDSSAVSSTTSGPRGRGRGVNLPAWMTDEQKQQFLDSTKTSIAATNALSIQSKEAAKDDDSIDCEDSVESGEIVVDKRKPLKKRGAIDLEDQEEETETTHPSKKPPKEGTIKRQLARQQALDKAREAEKVAAGVAIANQKTTASNETKEPSLLDQIPPSVFAQLPALARGLLKRASLELESKNGFVHSIFFSIRICSMCEEWKAKSGYTDSQWKGGRKKRACIACWAKHSYDDIQLALIAEEAAPEPKKKKAKKCNPVEGHYGPSDAKQETSKSNVSVAASDNKKKAKKSNPGAHSVEGHYGPSNAKNEASSESTISVVDRKKKETTTTVGGAIRPADKNESSKESSNHTNEAGVYGPADEKENPKEGNKQTHDAGTHGSSPETKASTTTVHVATVETTKTVAVKAAPKTNGSTTHQYQHTTHHYQHNNNNQHQSQGWESLGAPPPLPNGWKQHWDPKVGRPYYEHSFGNTTWTRPYTTAAYNPPLPFGWSAYCHPRLMIDCYFNAAENRWAWEPTARPPTYEYMYWLVDRCHKWWTSPQPNSRCYERRVWALN